MIKEEFIKSYYDLLVGEYKGINLTRITDYEEFKEKQIVDSVEPYHQSQVFKNALDTKKAMLDIGFGGGFPILPMAELKKEYNFYGVETRGKKVKVVSEISQKLGQKNVELFHSRIENVLIDIPCVCTFKAVGKVNDFLSKINSNELIQVFFYKGPNYYEFEKEQIELAKKNWKIIEEIEINIPGVEKRYLIGFEGVNKPKKANNLVKLTDLI